MTIALWCVLAAALLPLPFAAAAKTSRSFDNARPREYLAALEGWRHRSNAAQMNGFEAFPPFAAAVIIATLLHAPQARMDAIALAFIGFRVLFGLCYIFDQATLRSLMWTGGTACTVALFVVAA